jgi:hypothetical protein
MTAPAVVPIPIPIPIAGAVVVVVAGALASAPAAAAARPPAKGPTAVAVPWAAPTAAAVEAHVRAPWRAGVAERLADVTEVFVGAPYAVSPLGEGAGVDPDPRLRFDTFDCTTFVETALALGLGRDLDDARSILDRIRYRGAVVDYAERRHFPESEWIPGLTAAGLLVDVTAAVAGPDEVMAATKTIDRARWSKARGRNLPRLQPERLPTATATLAVWRLDAAAAQPEKIPSGTVLHVVRVDFKNVPVRVSHQGLVVEKDGRRFLRHAADRIFHRVVDEPLDLFLARLQHAARWPVVGVHLTQVVPADDWRTRLGVPEAGPDATPNRTPRPSPSPGEGTNSAGPLSPPLSPPPSPPPSTPPSTPPLSTPPPIPPPIPPLSTPPPIPPSGARSRSGVSLRQSPTRTGGSAARRGDEAYRVDEDGPQQRGRAARSRSA